MLGRRLYRWVWDCPDDAAFATRFALANRRWRLPIDLTYDPVERLFQAQSDGCRVAVARRSRLKHYLSGVEERERQLIGAYMLEDVPLQPDDLVIDVGANIGEVSTLLARRFSTIPLAFEPSRPEFQALKKNLEQTGGTAWNEVLWSADETVPFHDANDTGDSSVFTPPGATGSELRQAITLDSALAASAHSNSPVKLLKLEAEGAEPEVLEGATATLQRVQHVVADIGPERGLARESTLIPVYELLRSRGFVARKANMGRPAVHFSR